MMTNSDDRRNGSTGTPTDRHMNTRGKTDIQHRQSPAEEEWPECTVRQCQGARVGRNKSSRAARAGDKEAHLRRAVGARCPLTGARSKSSRGCRLRREGRWTGFSRPQEGLGGARGMGGHPRGVGVGSGLLVATRVGVLGGHREGRAEATHAAIFTHCPDPKLALRRSSATSGGRDSTMEGGGRGRRAR